MIERQINTVEISPDTLQALKRNFYWSFHHSQGLEKLQTDILQYVLDEIKNIPGNRYIRPDSIKKELKPTVAAMLVPKEHTESSIESQHNYKTGFEYWLDNLIDTWNSLPLQPKDKVELIAHIAHGIMGRDEIYQSRPRPNRQDLHDPHESFFRKYAVMKQFPYTAEFNRMYEDINNLVYGTTLALSPEVLFPESVEGVEDSKPFSYDIAFQIHLRYDHETLVREWTKNHPNESWHPIE